MHELARSPGEVYVPFAPVLISRRDALFLVILVGIALAIAVGVAGDPSRYIRGDWPTFFLPHFALLGESLRAFDIPGWNPAQFAGAPFAGDPSSGWGYLPAMVIYALLPALSATTVYIAVHIAGSAVAAYILARCTGLTPAGALVSGAALALPWTVPAAGGMVIYFAVSTWLPIALIGVELARRPASPLRRLGGLAIAGLAISQLLGAWLGQGSYYALLVIGGWVAWSTLAMAPAGQPWRDRFATLFGVGFGVLALGLALSAYALLPRLDANLRSNVPGGEYTGLSAWAETRTGAPLDVIARSLIGGFGSAGWQYIGAAVAALALLAPFVVRRWPPLFYWLFVATVAIILYFPVHTPLHTLMYALLPRFDMIHSHVPIRVLLMTPLAAAMLAGAAADALCLGDWRQPRRRAAALVGVVFLGAGFLALASQESNIMTRASLLAALAALSAALLTVLVPIAGRAWLVPLALTAMFVWDPSGRVLAAGWGSGLGPERSLHAAVDGRADDFLFHNGAANFLAEATRNDPARYAGYDPALLPDIAGSEDLPPQAYRNAWLGPANWLLVHNWATWFGLEDVQGYNPIQVQRYVDFIDALNGHRQEYHEADIFPDGLNSPLLDLLNLRYLLVPADATARPDLAALVDALPAVYQDDHVIILERQTAFPRAWLVHEARQIEAASALAMLADGTIDPAKVALLDDAPPVLEPGVPPADVPVSYLRHGPDRATVTLSTPGPALLVISEVWDPGWSATVDGVPTPVYRANSVMQGVPVPAGDHSVELHYVPPLLHLGLGVSGGAVLLVLAAAFWLSRRSTGSSTIDPVRVDSSAGMGIQGEHGSHTHHTTPGSPLDIGGAVLLIGLVIALIVATWEPLEPRPRSGQNRSSEAFVPAQGTVTAAITADHGEPGGPAAAEPVLP